MFIFLFIQLHLAQTRQITSNFCQDLSKSPSNHYPSKWQNHIYFPSQQLHLAQTQVPIFPIIRAIAYVNKLLLAKITIGEYHISYTSPYPYLYLYIKLRITIIIIIIRSQGRRRTLFVSITLLLPVITPYTYPYIHIQRRYRNEQPKRLKYTGEERIKASQANTKIKPPLIVKIPGRKAAYTRRIGRMI